MLTDVDPWPPLCRDHHVLELMKCESLARHCIHGMVQHLACGIGVFDFVSRQCQEERLRIGSKVDRRDEIGRSPYGSCQYCSN